MNENPLLKKLPLYKDIEEVDTHVKTTVEGIYDKRLDVNFKYDPKGFKDRFTINPFKVDGFARVTFKPEILYINILDDRKFEVNANPMPAFYQHTSSIWEISLSPTFENTLQQFEDHDSNLNQHIFEFPELPFETNFYFRVKYYTNISYTEWSDTVFVTTKDLLPIPKPTITGEILNLRTINLHSSPYLHLDLPHTKTTWSVGNNALFDSIVFNKVAEDTNELANIVGNLLEDLITGHNYFARVKFHNKLIDSEWSDPLLLKIDKIAKPTIEAITLINPTTFTLSSSPYVHSLISHTESEWELSDNINFNNPIKRNKNEIDLLATSFTLDEVIPLDDDITYYFRVRYYSDSAFSDWSDTRILNITNIGQPIVEQISIIDNNKVHIKASSFVHSLLTHEATTYQISKDPSFNSLVIDSKVTDNLIENTIPIPEIESLINYYVRIRYHNNLVESEWSDITIIKTDVPKPIIQSVILTPEYNFNITSSNFVHSYLTHTKTLWEISYLNNFLTLIIFVDDSTNLITNIIDILVNIKPSTNYYIRNKYKCGTLESEYSEPFIFTTAHLTKPQIISNSYNPEVKTFTLNSNVFSYMDLGHTKTIWEISKFENFNTIIESKIVESPNNLISTTFVVADDTGETDYYFRLKQFSGEFESVWSDTLLIRTPSLGAIATPTITDPGLLCSYNFYMEASPFEQTGGITQTKTIWQICENDQFLAGDPTLKEIVIDSASGQSFEAVLVEEGLIEEGKTYFVRVKYLSEPTP